MNTTSQDVTATDARMLAARRAGQVTSSYYQTITRALVAAALIVFAIGTTAMAESSPDKAVAAVAAAKQGLWVANGTNVLEFSPGQLNGGLNLNVPPKLIISDAFGAPQGVQFDASGNLWVIDGGTTSTGGKTAPALDEFTPAQLANLKKVPNPTPNVEITSASFVFIQQGVFDSAGNFWVTDNGNNTVDVFSKKQLALTATIDPSVTISSDDPFTGPLGIVFQPSSGNLFVANNGTTTIFAFKKTNLATNAPLGSGDVTLVPDVELSDDGHNSIQAPWALIFDLAGSLWSSNANTPFTLVKFTSGQLTSTGSPTPAVTVSPFNVKKGKNTNPSLNAPNGIAFDNIGNLAAINSATPFSISKFVPMQLTTGGKLKPKTFIIGGNTTLNAPAGDVFGGFFTK